MADLAEDILICPRHVENKTCNEDSIHMIVKQIRNREPENLLYRTEFHCRVDHTI
mgnify:CR=1 FL=1